MRRPSLRPVEGMHRMLLRTDDHARQRRALVCGPDGNPIYRVEFVQGGRCTLTSFVAQWAAPLELEGVTVLAPRGDRLLQPGLLLLLEEGRRCLYLGGARGGTAFHWDPVGEVAALHEEAGACYCFDGGVAALLDEAMYLPRYPAGALVQPYQHLYTVHPETGAPYASMLEQAFVLVEMKARHRLPAMERLGGPEAAAA